ncbi:anti-sigma factor family protein [Pseudonocardia sp. CA-107938]|uniref:anti-sigma factor family protein n=1 Tax=Pseudonocardia sp. CA-107938 TaxID=3240021 RepID=UPI003D8E50B0
MTGARRRFTVTVPDWGSDHLSTEAVVAFVDDELAPGPRERAVRHLDACRECAAQVAAQNRARSALRTAETPCLPSSLLSSLRAIPQATELPPPPAGLAVGPDGQLVNVLRHDPVPTPRVSRRDSVREGVSQRRALIGATAAVSGLALGALAFGVSASAGPAPQAPERGVFNGSVLGGSSLPTDASLRLPVEEQLNTADHGVRSWLLGH